MDRLTPLEALDVSQARCAAVVAQIRDDGWSRPTPCDLWTVRDIVNKIVASTLTFAAFGRRERLDPALDLIDPVEMLGADPVATYLDGAAECRQAWAAPTALDGAAPSTIGEFPAKAVLNARIFDTTILTWDIATALSLPSGIDDRQAAYVLHVARALVPNVRAQSPERYKDPSELTDAPLVDQMVAATGRDPSWRPPS